MHELGITQGIVDYVSEQADGQDVRRVIVEVGRLSCIAPDAMRFCFDVCTEGTPLESATLDIIEVPGRARCRDCASELAVEALWDRCACGSSELELLAGQELRIKAMEVA